MFNVQNIRYTDGLCRTYPEDLYRELCYEDSVYGTLDLTERETCLCVPFCLVLVLLQCDCSCWCFWTFDVPVSRLARCDAIVVRAMDEGLGNQPRDMYWK